MCGISGIINYNLTTEVDEVDLKNITDAIAHRGPDGFGYWKQNNIALGHRRLSIIDLKGSKQPMSIENDDYTITYNGEIYNYLELKFELENLGYSFESKGDTEVVLKAYQEWDVNCVNKFRGMFSFAIVDTKKNEIFIARDHFGIKPLLYYVGETYFMFGSEIQQFTKHPQFQKIIDVNAIYHYFQFGYIPAPISIYKNLYKLEPGNYLRVSFDGKIIEQKEYYDIDFKADNSISYQEWVSKVESAIDTSVAYHKIADVPYGAFLSGGIDSSLISSSLAKHGKNVDVFTMGFHNHKFNEVPYAKEVAKKFDLKHHTEYIDMKDMEDVLPKLLEHYGEPFSDSSAIPTYYISKKIREHLPVVLSGDGGDEAFGGYYSYQNYLKILKPNPPREGYKNYGKKFLSKLGFKFGSTPRNPNLKDWISVVGNYDETKLSNLFNEATRNTINFTDTLYSKWYKKAKSNNLDTYSTVSYLDYKTYIHGDILTKVDIASMMNSLEVRTPLIDVEIINLMAKIPTKYKITRNYDGTWQKKKILNSIASQRFGKEFTNRKKQGFTAPIEDWFKDETKFGAEINSIIKEPKSKIYQYLDFDEVNKIFEHSTTINFNKKYQFFVLERWLKANL
tara:strand:- start:2218 stop:4077 length:1860 start_codon:yes stop_codon:yes gene_type:complete